MFLPLAQKKLALDETHLFSNMHTGNIVNSSHTEKLSSLTFSDGIFYSTSSTDKIRILLRLMTVPLPILPAEDFQYHKWQDY